MTKDIQHLMKVRNSLFNKYCKEEDPNSKSIKHQQFKEARNLVTSKIKTSKRIYYDNFFKKHKFNISKIWEGIRSLVTLKNKSRNGITSLNYNYNVIAEPILKPLMN